MKHKKAIFEHIVKGFGRAAAERQRLNS